MANIYLIIINIITIIISSLSLSLSLSLKMGEHWVSFWEMSMGI